MNDELQTAVVFTANLIENKNVIFLTPQKIIVGKCSDDTSYFYSLLDGEEFLNADDAIREQKNIGFYNVVTIGKLKEYYDEEDLHTLVQKYMNDIYSKVYYYQIGDTENFESYFMKTCSIEEFNNKFGLNFSYQFNEDEYEEDEELDPTTENFKLIKRMLDQNILFQDDAKNELISVLYNNCITNDSKSNIIISGPSGVGKTAALKLIEENSIQPILYHKYSTELIDDPKEYLNDLLIQSYYVGLSKNNRESFTIIIDDFDHDFDFCTNMEVLDELAKFLKNGKRFVPYSLGGRQGVIFDPTKVSFIICGNFNNVAREKNIPIDFFSDESFSFNDIPLTLSKKELEDNYGFSKECLDAFNTFIDFKPLNLDKTKKILVNSNNSLFNVYCKKLDEQGIKINIDDNTINLICEKVYSKHNNIKNINSVIGTVFKDIMLEMLSLDKNTEITINDETVKDHKKFIIKKSSKN